MKIFYYTWICLAFALTLSAKPPVLESNVVKSINDDLISTEANSQEEDVDKARDEMQDLKSEVEKLKLELEKKDSLVKEAIDNKNKQIMAQMEADFLYQLSLAPFDVINVDNKEKSYKNAYQKILVKEYVDIDVLLNQYIADANENKLFIVPKGYLTSYDEEDSAVGNQENWLPVAGNNTSVDNNANDSSLKQSTRDKILNDSNSNTDANVKNTTTSLQNVENTIISKEVLSNEVSKAYFLIGQVQLINLQIKEALTNFSNAYKISKNVDVQIHSLFGMGFVYKYQKKEKELCFTLLRISQTIDLYKLSDDIKLNPDYQEKLQNYYNENNC